MINHQIALSVLTLLVNNMNLLQVDDKLIALCTTTAKSFNITDNLPKHTIRKVILNDGRFVILTTTNLYYLYLSEEFVLDDITDSVARVLNIGDITFIVNSCIIMNHIGIITKNDNMFRCKMKEHTVKSVKREHQFYKKDIVGVSNREFGYIYKYDGKYVIEAYTRMKSIKLICTLDGLPTSFLTPNRFVYSNAIINYNYSGRSVLAEGITRMCNQFYYIKNNTAYCADGNENHNYGVYKTDKHRILDVTYRFEIWVDVGPRMRMVTINNRKYNMMPIAKSYYCAKSLGQYSNDTIGVGWSIGNHHLFGKYVRIIIHWVMLCYKYSGIKRFIPKGPLFMILQYVAL